MLGYMLIIDRNDYFDFWHTGGGSLTFSMIVMGLSCYYYYYFWNKELTLPDIILAEINNTPWDERYSRAFKWTSSNLEKTTHKFDKEFHVSPFMPMEIGYIWEFGNPGKKLSVHMINEDDQGKTFEASMNLSRKPINFFNLTFALVRFPLITISILLSIYFNAMLLKIKGCNFYPHPDSKSM